jgi:hypothetical protein
MIRDSRSGARNQFSDAKNIHFSSNLKDFTRG